jgi:hypothetical protein
VKDNNPLPLPQGKEKDNTCEEKWTKDKLYMRTTVRSIYVRLLGCLAGR